MSEDMNTNPHEAASGEAALHEKRHQNQMREIMNRDDFPSRTESGSTEENAMPNTDDESLLSLSQRVETFYDHYKEGVHTLDRHIVWRIRIGAAFVFLVFTMILQISNPKFADEVVAKVFSDSLEPSGDSLLLNTALWFALTIAVIALYSRSVSIVQQALELRRMETRLAEYMPKEFPGRDRDVDIIHRRFLDRANFAYQFLAAILLVAVLLLKLYAEVKVDIYFFTDLGFAFVILYFGIEAIIWQRNLMAHERRRRTEA